MNWISRGHLTASCVSRRIWLPWLTKVSTSMPAFMMVSLVLIGDSCPETLEICIANHIFTSVSQYCIILGRWDFVLEGLSYWDNPSSSINALRLCCFSFVPFDNWDSLKLVITQEFFHSYRCHFWKLTWCFLVDQIFMDNSHSDTSGTRTALIGGFSFACPHHFPFIND